MSLLEERYAKLNEAQRLAVDTVDGAVLVVAGPGSGKTEILALRVARILSETDAGASSVLCLTFTESAAATMRARLASLIGPEAYRVTIGTFHGFAQQVAEQYPDRFSGGAALAPAEAVERAELVAEALREQPVGDVLRTGHPSKEFTYLDDVMRRIEDLKKAGIGPDALDAVLAHNAAELPQVNALLAPFDERVSRGMLPRYAEAVSGIRGIASPPFPLAAHASLSSAIGRSLEAAVQDAEAGDSTKPMTAWKSAHLEKLEGRQQLKATRQHARLVSLSSVYRAYQGKLAERGLRDFDDLIVDLLDAMRNDADLRDDLRERYQYVLVDEYQDTNGAQAELLALLADHPANEGNPNLMVVGDDDQAIYRFHGAGIEHILGFRDRYPRATVVTMATNYRSRQGILDLARRHVGEIGERLVGRIEGLSKDLKAGGEAEGAAMHVLEAGSREDERASVAALVRIRLDAGVPAEEIAVIGRRHADLEALVPHLAERGIAVSYERQRDALADTHVIELVETARAALALAPGSEADAGPLLARVLGFAFWNIPRLELWLLSRRAYAERKPWADIALESGSERIVRAVSLLAEIGSRALDAPAELLIDEIVGSCATPEGMTSPFRAHHFGSERREGDPEGLLALVASLRSVILAFRESNRDGSALLADLVTFADLRRAHGERIPTRIAPGGGAVHLMTVHRAKGMEFEMVVLLHAMTDAWMGRGRSALISFPENLGISPAGDEQDDRLRSIYVAVTRAKREIVFAVSPPDSGRGSEPLPLTDGLPVLTEALGPLPERDLLAWQARVEPVTAGEKEALRPLIADFQLTATQLNDFLNVAEGGPATFFERHILRFPRYRGIPLRFGQAVHGTLERVAMQAKAGDGLPDENGLSALMRDELLKAEFRGSELEQYLARGTSIVSTYLAQRGDELGAATHVEVSFAKDRVRIGEARITGKIDVLREETDGTLTIVDYKTGRAGDDWEERGKELQRHANRRQLLFYALMVSKAERFAGKEIGKAQLSFVEPDAKGEILDLVLEPAAEELERVAGLVQAVYRHATELSFPDIAGYPETLDGMLAFEDALLTEES